MRDPLLDRPEPAVRVCAVCGFTLDHVEGGGYVHLAQVAQMANHIPVPVDPAEVSWAPNMLCDFCTGQPAPWVVVTEDFVVRGPVLAGAMRGNWMACPTCVDLVRRRRWTELISRVHAAVPHVPRKTLRKIYAELDLHMTGFELRPANE
jgi:hypothetical protein